MKTIQRIEHAVLSALRQSGGPDVFIGDAHAAPGTFGNIAIDFRLPGWTLRVVRDRGLYELWFQTDCGKEWHDFEHLLVAAPGGEPSEAGSFTSINELEKFLTRVFPRLKGITFDEQLEARLQEVRGKAAEENLQEIFGPHAPVKVNSVRARSGMPNKAREPQPHSKNP